MSTTKSRSIYIALIILLLSPFIIRNVGTAKDQDTHSYKDQANGAVTLYHAWFPKDPTGLNAILYLQNVTNVSVNYQVEIRNEQGALSKTIAGTIVAHGVETIAADSISDLAVGVYSLRVTATDKVESVVRVEDRKRASPKAPGLAIYNGTSNLANNLFVAPFAVTAIYSPTLMLYNPTPASAQASVEFIGLSGVPLITTITATIAAGGFVRLEPYAMLPVNSSGQIRVSANQALTGLLIQYFSYDGLDVQLAVPVITSSLKMTTNQTFHYVRVLKSVDEGPGICKSFVVLGNPDIAPGSFVHKFTAASGQSTPPEVLMIGSKAFHIFDVDTKANVVTGISSMAVSSNHALSLYETRACPTTSPYGGGAYANVVSAQLVALPRLVKHSDQYSIFSIQNASLTDATFTVNYYQMDGSSVGASSSFTIANGSGVRIDLRQEPSLPVDFEGSALVSASDNGVSQVWVDEYQAGPRSSTPTTTPVTTPAVTPNPTITSIIPNPSLTPTTPNPSTTPVTPQATPAPTRVVYLPAVLR